MRGLGALASRPKIIIQPRNVGLCFARRGRWPSLEQFCGLTFARSLSCKAQSCHAVQLHRWGTKSLSWTEVLKGKLEQYFEIRTSVSVFLKKRVIFNESFQIFLTW